MDLMPQIEKDGFAYAGDAFYAQASGHHRHRRASLLELKELFQPTPGTTSNLTDHPAHWYESQLIHYGLSPSKTKSVAKLRLLDAFNKGNVAVPRHLVKLEQELRKEWNKKERQLRKERQDKMLIRSETSGEAKSGRKTNIFPGYRF